MEEPDMRKKLLLLLSLLLVPIAAFAERPPVIMVLGDSLAAAWGIDREQGWVALLQQRLTNEGFPHRVVNASVSGETTSGALSRVRHELDRHLPTIVILELGGNDGLRGLDLAQTRGNLARLTDTAQAAGARVLIAGMQLPPNYGAAYASAFHRMYAEVATEHGAGLIPFLLEGLDHTPRHFQPDGIHPSAEAQTLILNNVWDVLKGEVTRETRRIESERTGP